MWDYDLAKAIKTKPSNDFEREWYKATYDANHRRWNLLGGQLKYKSDQVVWCWQAKYEAIIAWDDIKKTYVLAWVVRELTNGLQMWALLDTKQNKILMMDVVAND